MKLPSIAPSNCTIIFRTHFSRRWSIGLLFLGAAIILSVIDTSAQRQVSQSGTMTVTIRPQIELRQQGTDVILKVRLGPGTNVKLWAANPCGFAPGDSATFIASGTYTVSLQNLAPNEQQPYVCAASSDGFLEASLLLQQ